MSKALIGKILIALLALFTGVAGHLADMNETHVYNPAWPPHAKFHTGQTLAFALLAAIVVPWFLWRRGGDARTNIVAAIVLAGLYWVAQSLAILYPNTAFFDPQFDHPDFYVLGLPLQAVIQIAALILLTIAAPLALADSPRRPAVSAARAAAHLPNRRGG